MKDSVILLHGYKKSWISSSKKYSKVYLLIKLKKLTRKKRKLGKNKINPVN